MSYTSLQEELTKRVRPMGIRLNGVWQPGKGVYESIVAPFKAKIMLNGKAFVVGEKDFLDLDGYDETNVQICITQRNIRSLPTLKKKKTI